jgi:hypothetical protein
MASRRSSAKGGRAQERSRRVRPTIVGRDADFGIKREPSVLLPLEHGAIIVTVKRATTHKPTHDPLRNGMFESRRYRPRITRVTR